VLKLRRMRWVGNVARIGESRGAHKILVGKPEGQRPLGRLRQRWQGNIKMDLEEIEWRACTELIWIRIGTGGGLL
jgi:hypothetical protein